MKNYTDEEITAKVHEVWNENTYEKLNVEIRRNGNYIDIVMEKMYSAPILTFSKLHKMALYFDTMNVETESEFNHSGCDTCDYGSSYGFTLRISDGDSPSTVSVD